MAMPPVAMRTRRRSFRSSGAALSFAGPGTRSAAGCTSDTPSQQARRSSAAAPVLRRRSLATLRHGHVVTPRMTGIELARAPDLLHRVFDHLVPLCDPADRPRDGEEDGEHRDREPHGAQDDAGIEIDIWVELAIDEIAVLERDALQLHREVEKRLVADAERVEHLVAGFPQHGGARVVVLVDAVAEAHEPRMAVLLLDALQKLRNSLLGADLGQHLQDRLVGAAMGGAPERGDAGSYAGEGIGTGRAGDAHRRGGRILLVIGMEDEDAVHGA